MAMTLEEAQRLENTAPLRLKFVPQNEAGYPTSGIGSGEYRSFFASLPEGWSCEWLGVINTRTGGPAWQVSDGQVTLVTVKHETGIEIILVGVTTSLLSAGALGFVKWAWKKWRDLHAEARRHDAQEHTLSLIIEVPRPNSAKPVRLVLPPPVSDDEIARYVRIALQMSETPAGTV